MAQPAARRKQAQQKAQQSNADNMTLRAKLYFPTAIPMDEDVVWRRDIYRELNLTDDANAALYYPVEPTDGKMNLFTYIFKLMFTGRVPVYQYRMDGNEDFSHIFKDVFCGFSKEISIFAAIFPHKSVGNKELFPHLQMVNRQT